MKTILSFFLVMAFLFSLIGCTHPALSKVELTPGGEKVILLVHEEAPKGAKFLGDIEIDIRQTAICVKNELRNQAARMGGNLVVVDNISPVGTDGLFFSGSGRVYHIALSKPK